MKKWREGSIRRCIREGVYFKAVSRMLDLVRRELNNPTQRKRSEKILTDLMADVDYVQKNYYILKRKYPLV
jgi:hypothetical protein